MRVPDVSVEGWQTVLDLVVEKGWKHEYTEGETMSVESPPFSHTVVEAQQ
ncbi:hypothetical protein [Streptomyces sp. NPDC004284]